MKLSGNTILITGGSTGIGLAFAKAFVELGNTVIVTGRRQAKLDEACAQVKGLIGVCSDAGDAAAVKALAAQVTREHPALNVLVNNAGIMCYRNLGAPSDDLEKLTQEIDINVSGPVRLVSAFVGHLKQKKGTIINVSSGLAFVPLQAAPIYSATKAFLHSYTLSLRAQLQDAGVEVVELMPPAVKTELADLPEDTKGFKVISTDVLVKDTLDALKSGALEIRPGQANQLHWMSRIAPGFIGEQLFKGSRGLIPQA